MLEAGALASSISRKSSLPPTACVINIDPTAGCRGSGLRERQEHNRRTSGRRPSMPAILYRVNNYEYRCIWPAPYTEGPHPRGVRVGAREVEYDAGALPNDPRSRRLPKNLLLS